MLFASGYAESLEVPDGMHVIGKPFSIDQLRDKVKGILQQVVSQYPGTSAAQLAQRDLQRM